MKGIAACDYCNRPTAFALSHRSFASARLDGAQVVFACTCFEFAFVAAFVDDFGMEFRLQSCRIEG